MRALLFFAMAGLPSAFAGPTAGQAFPDSVTTIETDAPLPSWGRLGGVTVDRLGFIYVSNFHDAVWRITPDGEVTVLSTGMYGSSGNAIDSRGNLLQSNFFANTIVRVGRDGGTTTVATDGLAGPVGIAVDAQDNLFVCNCTSNSIEKVSPDGTVHRFASGELFSCPNGITMDAAGTLYVVNFNTDDVIRLGPDGVASVVATLPTGGNAHIVFARNNLYVSKITTNTVYRVTLDGEVSLIAGTGAVGMDDGAALEATLARPNGIAASPGGDVLYVNNLVGEWRGQAKTVLRLRRIKLVTLTDVVHAGLERGGPEAAAEAYRAYKGDPARAQEHTLSETIQLAFRLLSGGDATAALALFQLNVESYPEAAAAHYNLGEGYRFTGQTDRAIAAYEMVLQLDPAHQNAAGRLRSLRS